MPFTCIRWRPTGSSQHGGDPDTHHGTSAHTGVLVTTQSSGVIHHWHVQSGKCTHTIKEDNDNNLYALDFTQDGRLFATAGSDTRVSIYDEMTKQKIHVMAEGPGHHVGHSNRVFTVKFHPQDQNLLVSGGWDRTIQLYDLRTGSVVDSIFGPQISGDSLDLHEDLILTGSNRNKDVVQIFSLQKRQLIQNVDWELSSKKDLEAGFVYGARFSKPSPNLIFAGGAGRNEVKIFENNVDG